MLAAFLLLIATAAVPSAVTAAKPSPWMVETVRGPVAADSLGRSLCHEHVLVDFIGADRVNPAHYDPEAVIRVAQPHLTAAVEAGISTLFECTPAYLARDPALLRRLSERTGLHLITNTGFYGAGGDRFLPPYAHTERADQLAARWIAEARAGIDGTGIKPGFIKTGVDRTTPLSPIDRKLVVAAALTHRATGLSITVHTGAGPGLEIMSVLRAQGVHPEAFIWAHAQNAPAADLLAAAAAGAWISLDGVGAGPRSLERHAALLTALKRAGRLDRVLLSHDAGWFDPAKPDGGVYRGHTLLFTEFIPRLLKDGFTAGEIDGILTTNIAQAFGQRPRLLPSTDTATLSAP
jgi:phosphotriesterase-related protein